MDLKTARELMRKYYLDRTLPLTDDYVTAIDMVFDVIDAEIARQSVSNEDADRAVDWLKTGKYTTQVGDNEYEAITHFHPDTTRFKQTAITALEQMRTEPCERCNNRECALSGGGEHCPTSSCSECKHYILDFNYCPNCGRKLGDE